MLPLRSRCSRLLLCLGSLACVPLAGAGQLTTADGAGGDNQIMGFGDDREGLNKGGAASMEVRGHSYSGNSYYGVLRFDLSSAEGFAGAEEATLTLAVTGDQPTPGTLVLFGLDDGYAGGPDESGKPELAEDAFAEGSGNWAASSAEDELTGDNAPGLREKMAGTAGFSWFGAPITKLGEAEVKEDSAEVSFGPSEELAGFLEADTNGTAVFYLVSDDAFVQLGTKEGGKPAALSID